MTTMPLKDLAAINKILDDLWERRVTVENFTDWRRSHSATILTGVIRTEVMLDTVKMPVTVTDTDGAVGLVTGA